MGFEAGLVNVKSHREELYTEHFPVYTCFGTGKQTSVAADFAIWRRAFPPAFPWADVTLEFTSVSMPTSSTVTVSTVTLAMAWKQIRKQQVMSSLLFV